MACINTATEPEGPAQAAAQEARPFVWMLVGVRSCVAHSERLPESYGELVPVMLLSQLIAQILVKACVEIRKLNL